MPAKDLSGVRFGRLVAIRRAPNRLRPNGKAQIRWFCMCDCGGARIVSRQNLRDGKTRSCGCICVGGHGKNLKDLTSQLFGRLLVMSRSANQGKRVMWLCQCVCGEKTVVLGANLRYGQTKSCGCLRTEALREYRERHRLTPEERRDTRRYFKRGVDQLKDWYINGFFRGISNIPQCLIEAKRAQLRLTRALKEVE